MNFIGMEFGISRLCNSARRRIAIESASSLASYEIQSNDCVMASSLTNSCDALEAITTNEDISDR